MPAPSSATRPLGRALIEGSYLLRSPANARRLLKAYENALGNINVSERGLIDPDAVDPAAGAG
jgi:antitoxin YefM